MSWLPDPLRIPAFRNFWLARLASTMAQMAMVIVIGWQVYDIARQTMDVGEAAFQLGLIGLVQFVPLFALTPVSGGSPTGSTAAISPGPCCCSKWSAR